MPQAFIGNPVTGENLWEEDMPLNGISGWTAPLTEEQVARLPWNQGVVPAGGAFRLPGVDPETYRAWSEGYGPETADKVLREPIRQAEQAVGILEGLRGGVPDSEINRVKAGFNEAVNRLPPLVQAGMDVNEADALLLAPLRDQTQSLAAKYKYQQPSSAGEKYMNVAGVGLVRVAPGEDPKVVIKPEEKQKLPQEVQSAVSEMEKAWVKAQYGFQTAGGMYQEPNPDLASRLEQSIKATRDKWLKPPEPKPGSSNAIRSFGSETAARQAGLGSGDVVYLIGIGKVRLK